MKLWKPKNGKKYYCVSVIDIAYLYYKSHNNVSPYFIGYDENTKPFLCGDSVQIMQRTWNASKEDYERLLSLNVFATYEEALSAGIDNAIETLKNKKKGNGV